MWLKYCVRTSQNSFCCKCVAENATISWLCSSVWQKCNVVITCNIIAQTVCDCAYLKCSEIRCAKCRTSMRNEHVNNGSKMQCILAKPLNHCSAKITRKILVTRKYLFFFHFKNDFRERRIPFCDISTYVSKSKTWKFFMGLDYIRSGQKKILNKKFWPLHVRRRIDV